MKTKMHRYDELNLSLQQMKFGHHRLYCDSFVMPTILLVTMVKDITQGMNITSSTCVFALAFRLHCIWILINVLWNMAHSRECSDCSGFRRVKLHKNLVRSNQAQSAS